MADMGQGAAGDDFAHSEVDPGSVDADKWGAIFERLSELQQNQDQLAAAIDDLGHLVKDTLLSELASGSSRRLAAAVEPATAVAPAAAEPAAAEPATAEHATAEPAAAEPAAVVAPTTAEPATAVAPATAEPAATVAEVAPLDGRRPAHASGVFVSQSKELGRHSAQADAKGEPRPVISRIKPPPPPAARTATSPQVAATTAPAVTTAGDKAAAVSVTPAAVGLLAPDVANARVQASEPCTVATLPPPPPPFLLKLADGLEHGNRTSDAPRRLPSAAEVPTQGDGKPESERETEAAQRAERDRFLSKADLAREILAIAPMVETDPPGTNLNSVSVISEDIAISSGRRKKLRLPF